MSSLKNLDLQELKAAMDQIFDCIRSQRTRRAGHAAVDGLVACVERIVDRHIDAALKPIEAKVEEWERCRSYNERVPGGGTRPMPQPNHFRALIDEAKFL